MITENLSTLKIHKLTQEQYDREFEAGNIDENALYLTPDEEIDFPVDSVNGKIGAVTLSASDVGARPNTWMPTAEEVGADPLGTAYNVQRNLDSHTTNMNNPHGTTAEQIGAAPAEHYHSNYLLSYALNAINIDNTDGNWTVDIAGAGYGTVPADWVNVTQTSSGHFYVQTAKQVINSSDSNRRNARVWYREKYMGQAWSAWNVVVSGSNFNYSNGTLYINI